MKLKPIFLFSCIMVLVLNAAHANLHPQGKFDFLKGQAAYQKGDYQTAINHLKDYLKKDTAGYHRVFNALGQSYHKLKNYKEAEKYYNQAIDKAASLYKPLYRFNVGVLYYDMKNFSAAAPHLTYAAENLPRFPKEEGERKALAWYYLGHANLKNKAWKQASYDFEQSAQYTTKLNQGASFYRGIAEYNAGNLKVAENSFKLAKRIGTSRALNDYADKFLAQTSKVQKKGAWGMVVGGGYTDDDNVLLEPDNQAFSPWVTSLTEEKGGYGRLIVVPSYMHFFKNAWSFQGKGNLAKTYNEDRSNHKGLDSLSAGLNFIFSKDLKAQNALLFFDAGMSHLRNGADLGHWLTTEYAVDTTYQKTWNNAWVTSGMAHVAYIDYTLNTRDGYDGVLSVAQNYSGLAKKLSASLGLGVGKNFETAQLYKNQRYIANIGLKYLVWDKLSLEPMYDIRWDKNKASTVPDQTTYTAQIGLSYPWNETWSSSLVYSRIKGVAQTMTNSQVMDYHRNLISLMVFARAL